MSVGRLCIDLNTFVALADNVAGLHCASHSRQDKPECLPCLFADLERTQSITWCWPLLVSADAMFS